MVSGGQRLFTLLGFMGMYTVLTMLFLFLVHREIEHGPEPVEAARRPCREPAVAAEVK